MRQIHENWNRFQGPWGVPPSRLLVPRYRLPAAQVPLGRAIDAGNKKSTSTGTTVLSSVLSKSCHVADTASLSAMIGDMILHSKVADTRV